MKKLSIVAFALLSVFLVMSCKTTEVEGSGIKGNSPTVVKSNTVIIDYQGASFGSEVPKWVTMVSEGQYSQKVLSQYMPGLENCKVFVADGTGDNLEFVTRWTDTVDIETQVADTMQRIAQRATQTQMDASSSSTGDKADPSTVTQTMTEVRRAISLVELNGLEKVASYWVKTSTTVNKDDTPVVLYHYYSVWAMDQEIYNAQLDSAVQSINDNTNEGQALKDYLLKQLTGDDAVVVSNDSDSVVE